jgi:hypothetical protein
MKKLFLGIGAIALISIATLVVAQTPDASSATATPTAPAAATVSSATTPDRGTALRLAAMDTSVTAFRKLDTDNDGRISPLEAAANPKVAAAFTMADKDKDGYLSREEFEALSSTSATAPDVAASSPSGDRVSDPSGDQPATGPNEESPTSTTPSPRIIARSKR